MAHKDLSLCQTTLKIARACDGWENPEQPALIDAMSKPVSSPSFALLADEVRRRLIDIGWLK